MGELAYGTRIVGDCDGNVAGEGSRKHEDTGPENGQCTYGWENSIAVVLQNEIFGDSARAPPRSVPWEHHSVA
jgi:hypothetical protein